MAELVNPPYGYFAPGSSLFTNPLGAAPIIGPRQAFVSAKVTTAMGPSAQGIASSIVLIDGSFPHAGRCYLFEYGVGILNGTVLQNQLVSTQFALSTGPTGAYSMQLAVPLATSSTPAFAQPIVETQPQLLITTGDLLALAKASNLTAQGPLQLFFVVSMFNSDTVDHNFIIHSESLVRFIEGMYG